MVIVTQRIAGIVFRTESTIWLPHMQVESYEQFCIENDTVPDVRLRIRKIGPNVLASTPPLKKDRLCGAYPDPKRWQSPLLSAPVVWDRVHVLWEQPAQTSVQVKPDHVIVYDFAHRVLDLFYTEEYGGGDDRRPEERFRVSDNDPVAKLFQLHQVKPDALTAAPLTAEEQKRLIRIAEFSPHMIPKLPLLLSPAVRAALQPGLEGSERMRVFINLDGLTIWNDTRNTVEYFYPEGGGWLRRNPEGCVSLNLRHIFAAFFPPFSAIMVHSSGVIHRDRAALFLAPDAGGKSTVLEQATDGLLLNDDQVIVRKEGDTFIAHATPFGRMTSGPCQAPVGGLFVLEKAPHFELTPLKPAPLVKSLWDEHRTYTSILPRPLKQRAFDLFYELCHQVPLYRMYFPKDYVDWAAIDAALA